MSTETILPPLPIPEIKGTKYHVEYKMAYTGLVHFTATQMQDYALAAIEADRQRRGEPVAWSKTAAEIRDFIDVHYISMAGADDPSDDDKYTLTAHDLLSAFRWWTGFAPQPAEPAKAPSDSEMAAILNEKENNQ